MCLCFIILILLLSILLRLLLVPHHLLIIIRLILLRRLLLLLNLHLLLCFLIILILLLLLISPLWGSNPWPYAYEAHALPAELRRRMIDFFNILVNVLLTATTPMLHTWLGRTPEHTGVAHHYTRLLTLCAQLQAWPPRVHLLGPR